mmetsp:Transcript_100689/g.323300  ORF Transcript_100689/g.323300 Transcript_100689/m.323300 type:complete len:228 (+) Transcript_100689:214-897(+)
MFLQLQFASTRHLGQQLDHQVFVRELCGRTRPQDRLGGLSEPVHRPREAPPGQAGRSRAVQEETEGNAPWRELEDSDVHQHLPHQVVTLGTHPNKKYGKLLLFTSCNVRALVEGLHPQVNGGHVETPLQHLEDACLVDRPTLLGDWNGDQAVGMQPSRQPRSRLTEGRTGRLVVVLRRAPVRLVHELSDRRANARQIFEFHPCRGFDPVRVQKSDRRLEAIRIQTNA